MKNCVISQRLSSVRPGLLRANADYGPDVDSAAQGPAGCRKVGLRRPAGRRPGGVLPAAVVLAAVAALPMWAYGQSAPSITVDDQQNNDGFFGHDKGEFDVEYNYTFNQIFVGTLGSGIINQTAGVLTANQMFLGASYNGANGTGFYNLGGNAYGTSSYSAFYGQLYVGNQGTGTVNQTGRYTPTGTTYIGYNAGSTGTYNLNDNGLVNTSYDVDVGQAGRGTFNQNGGTFTIGTNIVGYSVYLRIADSAGGVGNYTLNNGTLDATNATIVVGRAAQGTFSQEGGTVTSQNNLVLGSASGSSGRYALDGGTLSVPLITSEGGSSLFDFNGGTLKPSVASGTSGTHTLMQNLQYVEVRNGGAIIDTGGNDFSIQTSLIHSIIPSDKAVDGGLTKNGGGTLSLGGGNNTYTGNTIVNAGTLTLSNGSLGVANSPALLRVTSGSTASTTTFNLGGGSSVTTSATEVGDGGNAVFNQTWGTHTVGTQLIVGDGGGGTGTYTLNNSGRNNASSSLNAKEEDIGLGNGATGFFIQSMPNILPVTNTTGILNVGISGGTGTYTMSGYPGAVFNYISPELDTTSTYVGYGTTTSGGVGVGTFNQGGGVHTVSGTLTVGGLGGTGTYNINPDPGTTIPGGPLTTGTTVIGSGNGTGTFNQSSGSHTVKGSLTVGTAGGNGTYNLTGGTLTAASGTVGDAGTGGTGQFTVGTDTAITAGFTNSLVVGFNSGGNGTFTQNGGTVKVGGTFSVALNSGSQGVFNLKGGSLSANVEQIGIAGSGTLTQTGGSNAVSTSLFVGDSGGVGVLNMSNGTLSANALYVGYSGVSANASGSGTVNQFNGTVTAAAVSIGTKTNGVGQYNLNGGTLSTGGVHGGTGTSTFSFYGGTLQSTADSTDFFSGVGTSKIYTGSAIIDTNGHNVTAGQSIGSGGGGKLSSFDGGLTKNGAGTLTLTGNNAFTGGVHFNAGTVNVGSANALGTLASNVIQNDQNQGELTFNGGTLQYSAANQTDYSYNVSPATSQQFRIDTNGQNVTFNQGLFGDGNSLTKLGAGTLTLSSGASLTSDSTYTGGTTLAGGTLNVGGANVLGPSGTILFAGGTLQYSAKNQVDYSARISNASNQAFNIDTNGQNVFYANGLASSGGRLTKFGNGTLVLSGTNTFDGPVVVNQGQLSVGGGAIGAAGSTADLTVDLGYAAAPSASNTTSPTFRQLGGQTYFNNVYAGRLSSGNVIQSGGTLNASGIVYLGYNGPGTTTTTGNGFYQLQGGTLNAGGTQVGNRGQGTFQQTGGTHAIATSLLLGMNNGQGTYQLSGSGTLTAQAGVVGNTGTGTFTQTGGTASIGLVTIGNASGSTGTYNLNGGVLQVSQVQTSAGTSTFNFNGGTLTPTQSGSDFLQNLTTANVRNGGMIVDTAGYDVGVAQNVQHSSISGDNATDGGLSKLGAGVLTITGNNTFTGPTSATAGSLLVNNTMGSGTGRGVVTVSSGAVLGGSGTLGGDVTALAGAAVEPGATAEPSFAKLNVGGTLTLRPDAVLSIEIGGPTAGTGYDQVDAAGGFALGGDLQLTLQNGYTPTPGQIFTILDNTSALGGNTGVFANAADGIYTNAANQRFLINYIALADGGIPNDVTATYLDAVPEPGVACSVLSGAGLLLARHRRRKGELSARAS